MRIGADTWFLVLLSKSDNDAKQLFRNIIKGYHELYMSTLCVSEFTGVLLRKGKLNLAERIKNQIIAFPNIHIVPVSVDIATESAKKKYSLGLSLVDAVILTTALMSCCEVFIAEDLDCNNAKKQKIVRIRKPSDIL